MPDPQIPFNIRFPGQYYDEETERWDPDLNGPGQGGYVAGTGLHYNYHRYYHQGIGRYISADPIGQDGGTNLYRYAWNNPLFYYDPFGLDETDYYNTRGGRPPGMWPTNGNWGGWCWSGGKYSCGGRGMGNAPPTDSADQCYETHDKCYSTCKDQAQKDTCDADLVACLEGLDDDPAKWPNPPRPGTEEDSARYRRWAIRKFK